MLIPDVKKLIKLIKQSSGKVLLHLSDNTVRDLKNDSGALQFLEEEASKEQGIEISLSESKDYFNFVYYIMGGCL